MAEEYNQSIKTRTLYQYNLVEHFYAQLIGYMICS